MKMMTNAGRLIAAVLLMAPLAWAGALTAAQVVGTAAAGARAATVTGWVVDANSWLGQGVRGLQHHGRSAASAEAGTPLVILTDDGSIVFPVQVASRAGTHVSNLKLMPYAEQRVIVGGRLIRQGRENAIVIEYVTRANEPANVPPTPTRETSGVEIVARVVGLNSWLGQDGPGRDDSMVKLARPGEPLVLVDDSGYVLYPVTKSTPSGLAANGLLANYAEQTVRATGTLIERGGERAIMIDSVAAYVSGTGLEVSERTDENRWIQRP